MRLWTFQPESAIQAMTEGRVWRCIPSLSSFIEDPDFPLAYEWLVGEFNKRSPKPSGVAWPIWAWHTNYGETKKPDRRRSLFRNYPEEDGLVLIELEVPDELVLLSDFDDWHAVLNNFPIQSDEDYEADPDREFTREELELTWQEVFSVTGKDYVQACFWELRPEYLVKVHRHRKRSRP